jgi:hypothetical protein
MLFFYRHIWFYTQFTGVPQYDSNDTLADVVKHLPADSHIVMLYNPVHAQRKLLTNAINRMAIDQSVLEIEKNGKRLMD